MYSDGRLTYDEALAQGLLSREMQEKLKDIPEPQRGYYLAGMQAVEQLEKYAKEHPKEKIITPSLIEKWINAPSPLERIIARGKRYGLSEEETEALLEKQATCCAICGISFEEATPQIDHNHETGQVRGLLCHLCNTGLGHFRDDIHLLIKAANYLIG